MIISAYGVQLRSIDKDDIEQIRLWRNQEFVRKNMQFKGPISREQQSKWFQSLAAEKNCFFIFSHKNIDIGVVYIKDINSSSEIGEAGVFIGNQDYLNSTIPVQAILGMMDFAFKNIGLLRLKAKINEENQIAIKLNASLGYTFMEKVDEQFNYYIVDASAYRTATDKFRVVLGSLC